MSKNYEEMSVKELEKLNGSINNGNNHALNTYISDRRITESGGRPDHTPYDEKTEHGKGVQGSR